MSKVHNFSAGPAILPQEVFKACSEAVLDFNGMGMSLLEISHRSSAFVDVMEEARSLVKELLGAGDEYEVLFLGGGASNQFLMVAYNFLGADQTAVYTNTGAWAKAAIKEAKLFGNVNVIASSEDKNFSYIPKGFKVPADSAYFHSTSNNTIFGTQIKEFTKVDCLNICDMSSDIFSREFNVNDFDLIYAGAQKNMGPAGTTMVIVRKDILGKLDRKIPSMMDYQIHISKDSMYNTPPVFPIFASLQTIKWVKNNGGVAAMEKRNQEKADLIYGEIDSNPLFEGTAAKEDRSNMNVCFKITDPSLEEAFLNFTKENNCNGLKGHRSVGGFRASIYNALDIDSVKVLTELMKTFALQKA
ncbi:MAG: phosphoserine aminotransferase [Sphingobacteriales bacterium]|jgi:phosphoserine aminotransferase